MILQWLVEGLMEVFRGGGGGVEIGGWGRPGVRLG